MQTVLITGAKGGIGSEFVRQYMQAGWSAIACGREEFDVRDLKEIGFYAKGCYPSVIDVLINCAAIYGPRNTCFGDNDYTMWQESLTVNLLGPMRVCECFIEKVAASERKVLVNITSEHGSITNTSRGDLPYRTSKAALNMATKIMANDLRPRGIIAVALNPGSVRAGMGGPKAKMSPFESVSEMRATIKRLTLADSGRFLNYDGTELPW